MTHDRHAERRCGARSRKERPGADRAPGHPPRRDRRRPRRGRPRADHLRHRAQRGGPAPGRDRPAGRGPLGHPVHQDPGRGPRRRRQALPPEGHRPGPPGFDPGAALLGRRRRPRAQAPQLPPAHPEEDGPPGPALGPLGPGRRRPGRAGRPLAAGRCPSTKDAVAALDALGPRRPGAGRPVAATTWSPSAPSPTCQRSRPCWPSELTAYDVLRNDWVVFTDATLPGRRRARAEPRSDRRCVTPTLDPHPPGRLREDLRPDGRQRLRLRGRPPATKIDDPPRRRAGLRREGRQREHPQPQGQDHPQPPDQHAPGTRPDTKRAIVTLHAGDKIDLFES